MSKQFSIILLLMLLISLSACVGDSGPRVSVNFNSTQDISEDDLVYVEGIEVGEVSAVEKTADGSSITITLKPKYADGVMDNAAVVVNRLRTPAQIEIYNRNSSTDSLPVADGDQLVGLDSMFQLGAWMVGDAFEGGSQTLSNYISIASNFSETKRQSVSK